MDFYYHPPCRLVLASTFLCIAKMGSQDAVPDRAQSCQLLSEVFLR